MTPAQFRKAVRDRDEVCRKCGSDGVAVHHIFVKDYNPTSCDPNNGVFLCGNCHYWAHHKLKEFRDWIIKIHSQEWFDKLERKAKGTIKKPSYIKLDINLYR